MREKVNSLKVFVLGLRNFLLFSFFFSLSSRSAPKKKIENTFNLFFFCLSGARLLDLLEDLLLVELAAVVGLDGQQAALKAAQGLLGGGVQHAGAGLARVGDPGNQDQLLAGTIRGVVLEVERAVAGGVGLEELNELLKGGIAVALLGDGDGRLVLNREDQEAGLLVLHKLAECHDGRVGNGNA